MSTLTGQVHYFDATGALVAYNFNGGAYESDLETGAAKSAESLMRPLVG